MKLIQLLWISILLIGNVSSQTFEFSEGTVNHNGAIVKTLKYKMDRNQDLLEESFESWIDDQYNVEIEHKPLLLFDQNILEAKKVVIPEVSEKPLNLYVRVDKIAKNNSIMHVYASWGNNQWLSQTNDSLAYGKLNKMMVRFVDDLLTNYIVYAGENNDATLAKIIAENRKLKEEVSRNNEMIDKLYRENEIKRSIILLNKQLILEAQKKLDNQLDEYDELNERINNN